MRLAPTLAFCALALMLLFGCGGSGDSSTGSPRPDKSTPTGASTAKIRQSWEAEPACEHPRGASRWGCSVGPYRCQAVVTDRGWSVDCARPGRSIAFTVPPRK